MAKHKTLTLHEDTWKILTQMKLDRNFHSLGDLILSFIKEEAIKPKCEGCGEELQPEDLGVGVSGEKPTRVCKLCGHKEEVK